MRKEKLEELKDYIETLRTISRSKIVKGSYFLNREAYRCTLNNGVVITREKLIKGNNNGSAAIIMPVTKEKEVLVVVEPRVFTKETVSVGFPAGYLEQDESIYDGARRELREETGYVSKKLILLDSFYQDEGCSEAYNYSFIALDCEKKYPQNLDADEIVRYMTFNLEELYELENLGYINSANSKLTLSRAKKYLRK